MTPIMSVAPLAIKPLMQAPPYPTGSLGTTTITIRQQTSISIIEPATTIITTTDAGIMSDGSRAIFAFTTMTGFICARAVTGPISIMMSTGKNTREIVKTTSMDTGMIDTEMNGSMTGDTSVNTKMSGNMRGLPGGAIKSVTNMSRAEMTEIVQMIAIAEKKKKSKVKSTTGNARQ